MARLGCARNGSGNRSEAEVVGELALCAALRSTAAQHLTHLHLAEYRGGAAGLLDVRACVDVADVGGCVDMRGCVDARGCLASGVRTRKRSGDGMAGRVGCLVQRAAAQSRGRGMVLRSMLQRPEQMHHVC
jgi:hypothetical protein